MGFCAPVIAAIANIAVVGRAGICYESQAVPSMQDMHPIWAYSTQATTSYETVG